MRRMGLHFFQWKAIFYFTYPSHRAIFLSLSCLSCREAILPILFFLFILFILL
jgi:hypothetical protein